MRALAVATALFLFATPALAASPQVEAAVKVLQAIGSDPAKLDKFCKVMKIVEGIQERLERLEARITARLEEALGDNFKAYREAAKKIEDAEEEASDSKALTAAMDDLTDKCPN